MLTNVRHGSCNEHGAASMGLQPACGHLTADVGYTSALAVGLAGRDQQLSLLAHLQRGRPLG